MDRIDEARLRDTNDPYHYDARISFGIYKGQKINTSLKKSVTILDRTEYAANYPAVKDHWMLANILHNGEFYIGLVPKDAVYDVYYMLEPFGGFLAHTMVRFRFNHPVQLVAKTPDEEAFKNNQPGEVLENPVLIKDIILSVEATAPPGIKEFALVASFLYTRGLAFRVLSLTGRGIDKYALGEAVVKQYKLDLSTIEANKLFETAMVKGHNSGMHKMYQTLFSNCNWFTFDMLQHTHKFINRKQSLVENISGFFKLLLNKVLVFSKIYPPLAIFGLTWRNIRDVNAEKQPTLIEDPEFQRLVRQCKVHKNAE